MGDAAIPLPAELQSALESYKTNYASYKVTGEAAYKTAYERALSIVNGGITSAATAVGVNDTYIQGFINTYSRTNQDITALQAKSRRIQTEGPKLQDSLVQSKQLHSQVVAAADETSLYVKGGIVVGLLVIVGIIGAL
jgi:CHASE3 domain sensor protein